MKNNSVALMIYGEPGSGKNVFTEEKYKKLAAFLVESGFNVDSVLYHDSVADSLGKELSRCAAILVWVNPIEQQSDRKILDGLLIKLSTQGCFVSAHPDTILKMGTKEVLYQIRGTEFGGDIKLYHSFEDFKKRFLSGDPPEIRIIKQYRGNGGEGVFKIDTTDIRNNRICIVHAKTGADEKRLSVEDFFTFFEPYFKTSGMLIDQPWNPNIINGMVRCYLSGTRVTGFGYQEINALYPLTGTKPVYKKPGQRFYFSEDCGLFGDLKEIMEKSWVNKIRKATAVEEERLPLLWDADFFINKVNTGNTAEKYSLCEINVSSVSPFPESSIPYIAEELKKRVSATL